MCQIYVEFLKGTVNSIFSATTQKNTVLNLIYKPELVYVVHATDIFKTCRSKAHDSMIRKATFSTHAPY